MTDQVTPADRDRDERTGRYVAGNMAATLHALQSERLPPELEALAAEVQAFADECISDEGGVSEVPTRRRSLLEYRARLHRRILQLDGAIELRGLIDKKGRLRAGWLQQLGGLISQARALDSLLGLGRRAKPVTFAQAISGTSKTEA